MYSLIQNYISYSLRNYYFVNIVYLHIHIYVYIFYMIYHHIYIYIFINLYIMNVQECTSIFVDLGHFLLIFKSYIFFYYYINIYLHLPLQNLLRIAIPFTPTITSLYNLYKLLYISVVFIICLSNYFFSHTFIFLD